MTDKQKTATNAAADRDLGSRLTGLVQSRDRGPCLSPQEMARMLEGARVSRTEKDRMMTHIATCDSCYKTFMLGTRLQEGEPKERSLPYRSLALAASALIVAVFLIVVINTDSLPSRPDADAPMASVQEEGEILVTEKAKSGPAPAPLGEVTGEAKKGETTAEFAAGIDVASKQKRDSRKTSSGLRLQEKESTREIQAGRELRRDPKAATRPAAKVTAPVSKPEEEAKDLDRMTAAASPGKKKGPVTRSEDEADAAPAAPERMRDAEEIPVDANLKANEQAPALLKYQHRDKRMQDRAENLISDVTERHKNGNKKVERRFVVRDGKRHLLEIWEYDAMGRPLVIFEVEKDIKIQIEYFADGQVKRERIYQQGQAHGLWQAWDQKGNLVKQRLYRQGQLVKPKKREEK